MHLPTQCESRAVHQYVVMYSTVYDFPHICTPEVHRSVMFLPAEAQTDVRAALMAPSQLLCNY